MLLETEGRGHYVGCFFYVDSGPGGWWGEGDDMIFIDHDSQPTINGTGTEDYFNNAWCFHSPFSYPYFGCPLLHTRADGGSFTTMYRLHSNAMAEGNKITLRVSGNPIVPIQKIRLIRLD